MLDSQKLPHENLLHLVCARLDARDNWADLVDVSELEISEIVNKRDGADEGE